MNTGAKVAIGCGVALLVAGMVAVGVVVGGVWWAKGKVEKIAGNEQRIQDLQRRANENPFVIPGDGVIQEDRLLKFIDVRRRVFDVYVAHKDEIDALSNKKDGGIGEITQGLGILNEARLAQVQALADAGMSQNEYAYLVGQVYKTMWASEWQKDNDGKTFSQWAGEATDATAKSLEEGAKALESQAAEAEKQLTPEQREAMQKGAEPMKPAADQVRRQADDVREKAKMMDAPPQNIALFRKHEAELKKYAMGGLEWIGL